MSDFPLTTWVEMRNKRIYCQTSDIEPQMFELF